MERVAGSWFLLVVVFPFEIKGILAMDCLLRAGASSDLQALELRCS